MISWSFWEKKISVPHWPKTLLSFLSHKTILPFTPFFPRGNCKFLPLNMLCEFNGLMGIFLPKFEQFINPPNIFLNMRRVVLHSQLASANTQLWRQFRQKLKKSNFKVRLMHAFSKDMEILPFLAVLFKTVTAMSILGSRVPAVRTREPHSY